jgi:MFS family permease
MLNVPISLRFVAVEISYRWPVAGSRAQDERLTGVNMVGETAERAKFGEVFAAGEFRALWLAHLTSIAGDQLARVALTELVFKRTNSPLLTALTYATSYLPWVIGGLALSGLADRYSRRLVMIVCDIARALLVGAMALPGMPLLAMVGLLFAVTLLNAPFQAARSAMYLDIVSGERYVLAVAVQSITRQAGTVAGFVAGGLIVAQFGATTALLADAATFAVSAALVWAGVRARPAAALAGDRRSRASEIAAGVRLVFGDRQLRTLMMLGWLFAFYTVPEPLAVPYTAKLGHGTVAAGLVFAAGPFGTALGSAAFSRLVPPPKRLRWMGPLAVWASLILMLCTFHPGLAVSLLVFAVSGAFAAYQVAANAEFVAAAPSHQRSQAFGLANAGLQVSQGLYYVLAGAAAGVAAPATVIAVSGALGAVCAGVLAVSWHRLAAPRPAST